MWRRPGATEDQGDAIAEIASAMPPPVFDTPERRALGRKPVAFRRVF